ncbi:hypothetical protein ACFW1F_31765 [Streptomyces bungoensis]|uniref:hypothetical protein n=1 Tax=Streptomyces bungoensis TaxID=285568 RepID=UPI00342DFDAE
MNGDEQVPCGRVYGCDHDDPNPGPLPARTYAALVGGSLVGLLLDVTGWTVEELDGGVAVATELGWWPCGGAMYDPGAGEPRIPGPGIACRFRYCGDTPDHWPRPPRLTGWCRGA